MAQAETNSGGFGPGVPPLPIPNREVKPGRADGTAPQCGRVGRRLLDGALHIILWRAPFFCSGFLCTFIICILLQRLSDIFSVFSGLPLYLPNSSLYSFFYPNSLGVLLTLLTTLG